MNLPTWKHLTQKRHDGAEKIAMAAKEKGGPALLTYHHFKVKLPYYKKAAKGNFDYKEYKKEYKGLCKELHSHMNSIENMNQTKFQELVGKLEVVGELLIKRSIKIRQYYDRTKFNSSIPDTNAYHSCDIIRMGIGR